jgi:hypothetical protein
MSGPGMGEFDPVWRDQPQPEGGEFYPVGRDQLAEGEFYPVAAADDTFVRPVARPAPPYAEDVRYQERPAPEDPASAHHNAPSHSDPAQAFTDLTVRQAEPAPGAATDKAAPHAEQRAEVQTDGNRTADLQSAATPQGETPGTSGAVLAQSPAATTAVPRNEVSHERVPSTGDIPDYRPAEGGMARTGPAQAQMAPGPHAAQASRAGQALAQPGQVALQPPTAVTEAIVDPAAVAGPLEVVRRGERAGEAGVGADGGVGAMLARLRGAGALAEPGKVVAKPVISVQERAERVRLVHPDAPMRLGYEASQAEIRDGAPLDVPPSLIGNIGLFGAPQTGKTHMGRHLTASVVERGGRVFTLVPVKPESWLDATADIGVQPTLIDGNSPVTLPVFLPVRGFPLLKHVMRRFEMLTAFTAEGEEGANMYLQRLKEAATRILPMHGFDGATGDRIQSRQAPPSMFNEAQILRAVIADVYKNYSFHPDNIAAYISVRFGPLVDGNVAPSHGTRRGHPIDILMSLQTTGHDIISTGSIANSPKDAALLTTLWLDSIWEANYVLSQQRAAAALQEGRRLMPEKRLIQVNLEEAHTLAVDDRSVAAASAIFREMLENGIRVAVIDQTASLLPDEWLAQLSAIFAFRQPYSKDVEALESLLPFPETLRADRLAGLSSLPTGRAEVFVSNVPGWQSAMQLVTPDTRRGERVEIAPQLPPLRSHRSAACGALCVSQACERPIISRSNQIVREETRDMATGRVWTKRLFDDMCLGVRTTGIPQEFAQRYQREHAANPQLAECIITDLVEEVLSEHVDAIEQAGLPRDMMGVHLAGFMREALTNGAQPGTPFGETYVVLQLRVLDALEALEPLGGKKLADNDKAPPLRFRIPGVPEMIEHTTRSGRKVMKEVTVAERRQHLAECDWSIEKPLNRVIALGLLAGLEHGADGSRYARDLQLLYPLENWGFRHHLVDELTGSAPAVPSGPSPNRVAASWPGRFLQPRTDEAKGKKATGAAARNR